MDQTNKHKFFPTLSPPQSSQVSNTWLADGSAIGYCGYSYFDPVSNVIPNGDLRRDRLQDTASLKSGTVDTDMDNMDMDTGTGHGGRKDVCRIMQNPWILYS